jgi:outer membrane protein assembly factor BamB
VTPEKIRALGLVLAAKNNQTALLKNKQPELVEVLEAFARDPREILATGAADILGQWRFKWKFETLKRVMSQPLVVDQSIYLGSDDGNLYCVNAADGVFLWSVDLEHPFYNNAPFLADGRMYAIGADTMREVDINQKGKVVASFPNVTTQPCFANGLMYVTYSPSILKPEDKPLYEIRCQELASRRVRWKMSVPDEFCFTTPVLANNLLYVQASNKFFALEAASGKPRWTFDIYSRNYPRVTLLVDNTLLFGSSMFFYRLNAADGALLWKSKAGGEFESCPTYAHGVYLMGNNDSHLYAFTPDGKVKWKYKTIGRIVSAPQVGAAGVYFGSEDGNIYALDTATGTIKWKYRTGKGCVSSPAVANGMVFIGSNDNNMYGFSEDLK